MKPAGVCYPRGFQAGAAAGGIRGDGGSRLDVALVVSERPAAAAGVFTRNLVRAAPVVLSEAIVHAGTPVSAVVINSGNANACTGRDGDADARAMAALAAETTGGRVDSVLVCSTGVIGRAMPMAAVAGGIRAAAAGLSESDDLAPAAAIMTTDTVPKRAVGDASVNGRHFRVGGMAKGSGMIHPDMATLIVVVTTDAPVERGTLQSIFSRVIDDTFNCVTVDGDTSTNDTALLLANGAEGGAAVTAGSPEAEALEAAVLGVCTDLAEQVVADAEGATRYFRVTVRGAASAADARKAARTVALSPLVKTAIHGADPNWGRIVAALGRSGAAFDPAVCDVAIAGVPVFLRGAPAGADLAAITRAFAQPRIDIDVNLAAGDATGHAWGCDLTREYVEINADYTT